MGNRIRDEKCPAPDCGRGIQVAGYCDKHYRRLKNHGSLHLPASASAAERFWSKVTKTAECWEWAARIHPSGYGQFRFEGEIVNAHRVAYILTVGSIPADKELDHLCRNRKCVRPSHLEAVPKKVNILRGVGQGALHARKTHCKHGHPLSGDNIYPNHLPLRKCITCARNSARASAARRTRKKKDTND